MIIANPIYDVVFKYLMEDNDIARELLSTIIGEEIVSLTVKPQETSTDAISGSLSVSLFRLDFKAIVRTADGEHKKVLIELQKAKQLLDVMRFRRYLGDNYRKEDEVEIAPDQMETMPLPILTIYFLGFRLPNVEVPVLKVNRKYTDAVSGQEVFVREPFVELLTHDSYAIQIPRLAVKLQTRLENVLQVFSQEYRTEDRHRLDFRGDDRDPLVAKMLNKLSRAVASEETRLQMDVEDEIERVFSRELHRKLAEKEAEIEQERREKEAAIQREEAAVQREEALRQELEALKKQLNQQD